MKYSLDDVKKSMPKEKARRDALWVKLWVRPISYPLSCLALNLNISANTISVLAFIDAALGSALLCINSNTAIIVGMFFLNIYIVFDCMDGTMARTVKNNSYMGEFFDAIGGYAMCAFSLLAAAVCAYNTKCVIFKTMPLIYLVVTGALGSICDIFARLVYQKYTANKLISDYKQGKELSRENDLFYTSDVKKLSITYLRLEIDRQFGTGALFPPILFVAYFIKMLDVVVIVYSLYHILAFIAVVIIFCKKASLYDA